MQAIVVPVDLGKPMTKVEGLHIREIIDLHTDIEFIENIRTPRMTEAGFLMVADVDRTSPSPINFRANVISHYQGMLTGDVILVSEGLTPNGHDYLGDMREDIFELLHSWDVQRRSGILTTAFIRKSMPLQR